MICSRIRKLLAAVTLSCLLLISPAELRADQRAYAQFSAWPGGTDGSYFPLCVWLQSPSRASQYKNIGINTYMGLYGGPTTTQLSQLYSAGMYSMCDQNSTALTSPYNSKIVGWLLPDEPDNAQSNPAGGYYSPRAPYPGTPWATCPYTPVSTLAQNMRANDTTRPVILNLGQGVAWDGWVGRGIRTNHPEDYPDYIQSPDIVSFDIYPGNSTRSETSKKYWLVAYGVDRLVSWSDPQTQSVFNCIEVSNIHGDWRPEPDKIKMEIWSSIVHGSLGLIYFCHEFEPFVEAGVLKYADVCDMLTHENGLITQLSPVLHTPNDTTVVDTGSSVALAQIDIMVKRKDGYLYIFAVNMRNYTTTATFSIPSLINYKPVEVVGESRSVGMIWPGVFLDDFDRYGVHIYRIQMAKPGDANDDGGVDIADFVILKQNYGTASGAIWAQGDFNADGAVDIADFVILKQNYGQ